jgi:hypothetical protein
MQAPKKFQLSIKKHRLASRMASGLEVRDLFGIWVLELGISPLREPPFVRVNELERRLNIRSVGHPCFGFPAFDDFGNFVVPTTLAHEFVPDVNVVFGWLASHCEAPLQNLLIGAVLFHALDQVMIVDAEKLHAFFVEALSKVRMII